MTRFENSSIGSVSVKIDVKVEPSDEFSDVAERALYSALKIIEDCGYRWADEGSDLADVASEAADALRGFIGAADDND